MMEKGTELCVRWMGRKKKLKWDGGREGGRWNNGRVRWEWVSFVVSGSVGGSAQSFIKGKCCQDAGRLKARRCRCDLCSRYGAINHPAFVSTGCRCCCFCLVKTKPFLPHLQRHTHISKHAYAEDSSEDMAGWSVTRQVVIGWSLWWELLFHTHAHTHTISGCRTGRVKKNTCFSSFVI